MGNEPPSANAARGGAPDPPVGPELSRAGFEDLLSEVLHRVRTSRDEQVRWRLLLDAVVSMAAGLSLDELLSRIVRIAGDLVGARYAALGVLAANAEEERRLRLFLVEGIGEEEKAAIGDLPRGHGLLGLIIDQPEPLRLHDIAEHAQSFGFPANHPPMHSFLGVPIRTGEKVFGNLYLTEKSDGSDFTAQDESMLVALAGAAGVAIENATLHEEAARRQRWLEATTEITTGLLSAVEGDEGLQLVADLAREQACADFAWIVTGPDGDELWLRVVSGVEGETPPHPSGVRLDGSLARDAIRAGTPITVADISKDGRASQLGVVPLDQLGPTMMFPLRDVDPSGRAETAGVLALAWTHEHAEAAQRVDVALPAAFAEQAALAIRLARGRIEGHRLAVYEDRDRIGRDLHDVVIQRLFALGLDVQGTLRRVEDPEIADRLEAAVQEIDDTIRDIRRTIFELGSMGRSADLQTEVTQLVERAASALKFRPALAFDGPVRLRVPPHLVPDLLAVLAEALSNTSRHANASQVSVLVSVGDALTLRVVDDGGGVPDGITESGLANMRERAAKHGGRCRIGDGDPHGTVIEWSVPLT